MFFNPDASKTAQKELFSRKEKIQVHAQVERVSYQKQLGVLLDKNIISNNILMALSPKETKVFR